MWLAVDEFTFDDLTVEESSWYQNDYLTLEKLWVGFHEAAVMWISLNFTKTAEAHWTEITSRQSNLKFLNDRFKAISDLSGWHQTCDLSKTGHFSAR